MRLANAVAQFWLTNTPKSETPPKRTTTMPNMPNPFPRRTTTRFLFAHLALFGAAFAALAALSPLAPRASAAPPGGSSRPSASSAAPASSAVSLAVSDAVVARVNGKPILLSELKERALDLNVEIGDLNAAGLEGDGFRRAITAQVDEELLVQAAKREEIPIDSAEISRTVNEMMSGLVKGIGGEEKFNAFLKNSHLSMDSLRRMLVRREERKSVSGAIVGRRVIINGENLAKFEAERAAAGDEPGEVRLAQIFIECAAADQPTPLGAARLKRAVEAAKDAAGHLAKWPEIAARYTDDPAGRARGGLLGWVDLGSMDPAIAARARKMKAHEVTEPIATDKGYHVLYALERRTARDVLFEKRYLEEREKLVAQLRDQAVIEIYPLSKISK